MKKIETNNFSTLINNIYQFYSVYPQILGTLSQESLNLPKQEKVFNMNKEKQENEN